MLFAITFSLTLAACGDKDDKGKTTDAGTTTGNNATTGGDTTAGSGIDLGGMDIKLTVQILAESDPNNPGYTGSNQAERIAAQKAVEAKYNVKIVYQTYPDGAGWGPPREQAIINGVTSGDPIGHFYMITTQWVANLASSEAIAPVGRYIRDHAHPYYDQNQNQFGAFKGEIYTFDAGLAIHDSDGLYYNMDLWEEFGLGKTPAELWNEGNWTWDKFEEIVKSANAQMNDDQYPLAGSPSVYAKNMIPANGGYLINPQTNRVAFNSTIGVNTINFLRDKFYTPEYWEPAPEYDAGSAVWKTGNALFHPGELWFLNSDMRWLDLPFDLSYVPYPKGNDVTNEEYRVGKAGQTMWAVSGGFEKENNPVVTSEELFMIWNDLQVWKTHEEQLEAFEGRLINSYDDLESVDAHLSIVRNVYNEQTFTIGHSNYGADGFYVVVNQAVYNGDVKSRLDAVAPIFQADRKSVV